MFFVSFKLNSTYVGGRASVHGALGHRIDPLWLTYWSISRSSQCSTTGVTKAVVCVFFSCDVRHMRLVYREVFVCVGIHENRVFWHNTRQYTKQNWESLPLSCPRTLLTPNSRFISVLGCRYTFIHYELTKHKQRNQARCVLQFSPRFSRAF